MMVVKTLFSGSKFVVFYSKSRIREWFEKNKQNLVNFVITIPLLILVYFIPYTFMLDNKGKAIAGIVLQILTGAIIVSAQISSNERIKEQISKIIQNPPLFALLLTILLSLFGISILTGLGDVQSDRWSIAGGIAFFVLIAYSIFFTSLMFLRKRKWLRRKDYIPVPKDKFDVSDLSLRNVGILFGISLLLFLLGYFLRRFYFNEELWIQILLSFFTLTYLFTIFPLLIISPLYFLAFGFARFVRFIHKRNLSAWFWIYLFILWTWGGFLLILKEFK